MAEVLAQDALDDFYDSASQLRAQAGIELSAIQVQGQHALTVASGDAQSFVIDLDRLIDESDLSQEPRIRLFRSMLGALLLDGRIDLSAQLGMACSWGMGNPAVRSVMAEINHRYVVPAGLEITSHGLLRSFRFWSEDEKKSYLQETAAVLSLLSERYGQSCLGYGAVLSYQRSGDLSAHDDDLDVIVGIDLSQHPSFGAAIADVSEFLGSKGYLIVGRWPAFLKTRREGMASDIDVFIGLNEGGTLAAIPGPRRAIPWEDMFPTQVGVLFGVELPMPAAPERYLAHVYGSSWRIPQPGWQHRWNYAEYADIT